MAPITHIVLFSFNPGTPAEAVKKICDGMLDLKNQCMHPTSNAPYIKSSTGGIDNSVEGMQGGVTHAFIVQFESAEDRDYYAKKDPAHQAFVQELIQVAKGQVVDFTPGVF